MKNSTKIFAAFLVFLNFLLLHYIVSSIPLRLDLTEDGIYTLSDSSRSMIEKIEYPVTIDYYSSRSLNDLPAWFKTFSERVEQMLQQYENESGGKIRLNIIDPRPDTVEEERAIAAGLNGQELPSGDRVFLGMVVSQADSETVHPFFNWNRETFLEYDISRAIYEAQLVTKPRLGLITTLPLQAPPRPPMPGQPPQPDQFFVEQLSAQFDVESIEPTASELPGDIDLLAIIHPRELSSSLKYSIDQYALSGKPIFLAVDPSSIQESEQSRQMQMMGQANQPTFSDLPELLQAWGIEYDPQSVLVDPANSLAQGGQVRPSWLIFRDDFTNRDLLPSSELEPVLLLDAGALSLAEGATANWEPVLTTSPQVGTLQSMMLQFTQPQQQLRQAEAVGEAVSVAGLLTGEVATAFPDGNPAASDAANEARAEERLTSGEISAFIIADTDFLLDRFSIQRANFLGMQQVQKLNDNQSLAANFVEFLGGSRDLIGIRGKGSVDRSFDVVQKMEAEAQQAYQQKLQSVEAELEQINSQLAQLMSEQTGSGVIYATPEMEDKISEFQTKQAELKGEIRVIRRELRQGIESLGNTIGAINLLWAPIALVFFALYFNRLRRRN